MLTRRERTEAVTNRLRRGVELGTVPLSPVCVDPEAVAAGAREYVQVEHASPVPCAT